MTDLYRIFGVELSPYSVKVRSYFRYKQIPHQWVVRSPSTADEFQKYARLPIIPLVVTPEGESLQDSTPIIDEMEQRFPSPSIHPEEPTSQFMSTLLEEFGDEWGNKWMFHLRWARDEDCLSAGGRIAALNAPGVDDATLASVREQIVRHMKGRVHFVGSNDVTGPGIERSFRDAIRLLDVHLTDRAYLFGGRPAYADFAMWGQLYCTWTDPTGGALIEAHAPRLLDWVHRMLWPRAEGAFESWESLAPTLMPFIEDQVGGLFLPWSVANLEANAAGSQEFSVELKGQPFTHQPQKYQAKSLQVLRKKYSDFAGDGGLREILAAGGCLAAVQS